jgi:hypothetical protein
MLENGDEISLLLSPHNEKKNENITEEDVKGITEPLCRPRGCDS